MGRPYGSGRRPLRDRLLSQITVTEAGCWEFDQTRDQKGYGRIGVGGREGQQIGAHRASWIVHHGEIPDGLHVLHECDNPPCVNPAHLFPGTNADNHEDKVQKGRARGAPGETHPRHKLTETQVKDIRACYALGKATTRDLGREYGVSGVCIHKIVKRETWRHVA